MMNNDEASKTFGKLVARAWADEAFKTKLIADPAAVLAEEGIDVPAGVTVNVIENSDSAFTMVLPAKPTDLSDVDLEHVSGGDCNSCMCWCL